MIGGAVVRRAATAIVIGLAVGVGFGLRSTDAAGADAPLEAARREGLALAQATADEALAGLGEVLSEAIDHARRGSALTVAGDRPPAPELEQAADVLVRGAGTADAARRGVEELAGTASAVSPEQVVPPLPYSGPDLLLLASSLRSSAEAATLWVERRHATEAIIDALGEAVSALDRDLSAAAISSLDRATAPFALLDAWEERPALFRYWMKVTRELLDAARGIATATIAGDPVAQQAAAQRYAKAGEAARGADNALAVSLSEEGGAVSGNELRRLAAAAAGVADGARRRAGPDRSGVLSAPTRCLYWLDRSAAQIGPDRSTWSRAEEHRCASVPRRPSQPRSRPTSWRCRFTAMTASCHPTSPSSTRRPGERSAGR